MPVSEDCGPRVHPGGVTFRVPDNARRLEDVWLVQEVAWPRSGPEFRRPEGSDLWSLDFRRPDVDRMEYLLEFVHPEGSTEVVCDPCNPLRAPGAFGERSVIEFPEYRAPRWLDGADAAVDARWLEIDSPTLGAPVPVLLWASRGSGTTERLPLLVVHDGPEFARFSQLLVMLERLTVTGRLPAMRAALLQPVSRDEHYSASPDYARALAFEILPALNEAAPVPPQRRMRVGMGASLGGLAALHAHRAHPPSFGGLFLQSSSFFHHRYDRYDLGWEHFRRVRQFMDRVHAQRLWHQPIPVVITCGGVEQNLANNQATSLVLRAQGYPVQFHRTRDAHNWVSWRDAFDPYLVDLLRELWA